ncbi:hypothetical protein [Roseovarius salinarum]|uniref:hypothetical protein n=1 Tax=Roseovarius salinarum TaxID=1981892 RepID=UPI000C31F1B0|nr:hypothetical protein [Roseovarius salinarum]
MTTQLLLRYDHFDRDAFDAEAEDRAAAGLTQLQLWREGNGAHWALFDVNDTDRARAWVEKERDLGRGPSAHHLLETL